MFERRRGDIMHYWNGGGHMGWGLGGTWMPIWWIVGAVLIAAVVWALVKSKRAPVNRRVTSPEESLKHRYARGEIDRETYQRIRSDLKG
jgi:putative membrane protein